MLKQNDKGAERLERSFLEYLPSLYRDDKNMEQFLHVFEDIYHPIENVVSNFNLYFDPSLTPESLLNWLGSWFGLVMDASLPLERRRELVRSASELYRWRGTKHGLSEYLRIYTGKTPEISESITGMRLDNGTRLGLNARLGSSGKGFQISVNLHFEPDSTVSIETIRAIIDAEKPAHVVCNLQITGNN